MSNLKVYIKLTIQDNNSNLYTQNIKKIHYFVSDIRFKYSDFLLKFNVTNKHS